MTELIAVDGPSGAGKTVFAARLADQLRRDGATVTVIPTDDFATWADPVSWWPRLEHGVLTPVLLGRSSRYRRMHWDDGVARLGDWVTVEAPDVLIIEGVSSARRAIATRLSRGYWIDGGTAPERLERAVARDGEAQRAHLRAWQRFELGWFAVDQTRERLTAQA